MFLDLQKIYQLQKLSTQVSLRTFWQTHKPFPTRQILDSSKLKEFTDHNFNFHENGGKLSKRVENTVRKGEIARN